MAVFPTLTPLGYAQQTVSSSAANLSSIPDGARYALLTPADGVIRFRDDGTDPTASVGHPVFAEDHLFYDGHLHEVRVIADDTDVELNITYYGF